jgi:hypothetical protein
MVRRSGRVILAINGESVPTGFASSGGESAKGWMVYSRTDNLSVMNQPLTATCAVALSTILDDIKMLGGPFRLAGSLVKADGGFQYRATIKVCP